LSTWDHVFAYFILDTLKQSANAIKLSGCY